ncbi:MAG: hypothetical protein WKF91_17890 [Segetibacter sp.]
MKPTPAQKFGFLMKVYFGVSNNPKDDVNPYDSFSAFIQSPVGEMRWGVTLDTRKRSKLRFAYNYSESLKYYKVYLPVEDIFIGLEDEKTNEAVVGEWAESALFN